jgi:endonuclease YncB( thermonuclease family)
MIGILLCGCTVALVGFELPQESASSPLKPEEPSYRILYVGDVDRIVLAIGGRAIRVELLGVAKPKTHDEAPFHLLRQGALRSLLENDEVRVRPEKGPAGRVQDGSLVHLHRASDGLWINLEVVSQGYGTATDAYEFEDSGSFQEAEQSARAGERGQWSSAAVGLARSEQARILAGRAEALERANQLYNVRERRRRERRAAAAAAAAAAARSSRGKHSDHGERCRVCGQNDHRSETCNDK